MAGDSLCSGLGCVDCGLNRQRHHAASTSADCSQRSPWRVCVDRCLPADSLLPGVLDRSVRSQPIPSSPWTSENSSGSKPRYGRHSSTAMLRLTPDCSPMISSASTQRVCRREARPMAVTPRSFVESARAICSIRVSQWWRGSRQICVGEALSRRVIVMCRVGPVYGW